MATLSEAATGGDLRASLEALRDCLAAEIEAGVACKACGGSISSPTAPLAKQLRDTLNQLAALHVPKGSVSDDLKTKRAVRQAGVAKRAAGGVKRRPGGDRASG